MAIDIGNQNLEGNVELSGEELEAVNQILQQSVGTDINGGLQFLGYLGLGINILYVVIFVASAIGLYKLSKKLGDEHSWLAFIPLVQLYTYFKTAGYGFWKGLLLLIAFSILGGVLGSIIIRVATPVIISMFNPADLAGVLIASFIMGISLGLIVMIIATYFLYSGMAKRAGQTTGTAILMTLFPWCMMWIVANRIGQKSPNLNAPTSTSIPQETVNQTEL